MSNPPPPRAPRPAAVRKMRMASRSPAIGLRVRHTFAGYGTVVAESSHNLQVQWDDGQRGWAYRSECWLMPTGSARGKHE